MNPQQYQQIEALFNDALDVPTEQRAAYVRAHAPDPAVADAVLELLSADEHGADRTFASPIEIHFDRPAHAATTSRPARAATASPPDPDQPLPRVAGFELTGQLGMGATGLVYQAIQENPRRPVALKLLRPALHAPGIARRFERESAILGRLQHPAIAQVYQAGTTDVQYPNGPVFSQPYFALELVQGGPITEFAAREKLDRHARLKIFAQVCRAVDYAHRQGVIHRDLKPSNIFVNQQREAKVLDFGVARLLEADAGLSTMQTESGQMIGTPAYASPEQIAGGSHRVDARSDVYALGVVLYELLTGALPYPIANVSAAELARVIQEVEPNRMSRVNTALRGDLDTIVAKTLEKDPARRYPSAAALADDLDRYLRDEPIEARPASTIYRLRKFARRNRGLVAGLVFSFAALLFGLVGMTYLALDLAQQRDQATQAQRAAEREAAKVAAINAFLANDLFAAADPDRAQGRDVTVREVLDDAAATLGERFANQPEVEAYLRMAIGDLYRRLSRFDEATSQLERAVALYRTVPAELDHRALALERLAKLYFDRDQHREALKVAREVLEDLKLDRETHGERLAAAWVTYGSALDALGRRAEAEPALRNAAELRRELYGENHVAYADAIANLAFTLVNLGRGDEAEPLYRQALEIRTREYGEQHISVMSTLSLLGSLARNQGKIAEAADYARRSLAIARALVSDDHWMVHAISSQLGGLLVHLEEYDEAEPLLRDAVAGRERIYGPESDAVAATLTPLARLLVRTERAVEAEAVAQRAIAITTANAGADAPTTLRLRGLLADALLAQGKRAEARPHAEACHALATLPDADPELAAESAARMARFEDD